MKYGEVTLHYRLELDTGEDIPMPTKRAWDTLRHQRRVRYAVIETRFHGKIVAVERYANQGGQGK